MKRGISRFCLAVLLIGLVVHVSEADTYTWNNPGGGFFETATNWDPSGPIPGPPTDLDDAVFSLPTNYSVTFTQGAFGNNLSILDGDVIFNFTGGGNSYFMNSTVVGSTVPASLSVNGGFLYAQGGSFNILRDATVRGGNNGLVGGDDAFDISNGGALRGNLEAASGVFTNHGLLAPGNGDILPGEEIGTLRILVSNGSFQQLSDGTLEIQIRGGLPTPTHDVLNFSGSGGGTAFLGGTLSVPFTNGYVPQLNDTYNFFTAPAPGSIVVGQFESLSLPQLNGALAARIDYAPMGTSITFVNATTVPFSSGNLVQPPGFNSWDDTSLWGGVVPNSTSVVNVVNQQNYDGKIRLDPLSNESRNAFSHRTTLGGLTNTMTLSVPGETNFTAVNSLNVNSLGVIELDGGTVHAKLVKVSPGGEIVGNGIINGNVQLGNTSESGAAILSPGFSSGEVTIEQDLTVAPNGVVEIEIFDEADFDKVTVIQDANLGGMLSVDLSGAAPATLIGEEFEVLTAGDVNQTFAGIEVEGAPDYFVQPDYSELSLSLLVWGDGDMNCDGDYTVDDVEKFAMALTNPIAYFSAFEVFGEDSGDMNDDGFFDFDDIDEFSQIDFGGLTAEEVVSYLLSQTAAVPEPSAALLVIAACGLTMGGLGRQLSKRSSILGS